MDVIKLTERGDKNEYSKKGNVSEHTLVVYYIIHIELQGWHSFAMVLWFIEAALGANYPL